jgi:hypothetical protein
MDKEYVVVSAMKSGEFSTQYGKMIKYLTQFEGEQEACEWSMKDGSPAPTPGLKVTGSITDTQYGKKFAKAKMQGGFGGRGDSPEKQENITNNSSTTQSLNFIEAKTRLLCQYPEKAKLIEEKFSVKYWEQIHIVAKNLNNAKYSFSDKTVAAPSPQAPIWPAPVNDDAPTYDPSEYEGI